MAIPATLQQESAKLASSTILTFWVLDATVLSGSIFRFYSGFSAADAPIVWQGLTYTPYPVQATQFDMPGGGDAPARPSLIFGNVDGSFSALVLAFHDLVGATITRKRTFYRFLDGQPDADPTAQFPDDIFYIAQKVSENQSQIEFELNSSMDLDNLSLPKRIIYASLCTWIYRGTECSFAGDHPVTDQTGTAFDLDSLTNRGLYLATSTYHVNDYVYIVAATPYGSIRRYYVCTYDNGGAGVTLEVQGPPNKVFWTVDQCAKDVPACKLHFAFGNLPFAGFPGCNNFPLG